MQKKTQISVLKIKNIQTYLTYILQKNFNIFKRFNIKPIFLSTDLVFSGVKGKYVEKDIPKPKTLYGKQKLIIEKYIKKNFQNYLIFRLSKTYSFKKNDSFTNWINFF